MKMFMFTLLTTLFVSCAHHGSCGGQKACGKCGESKEKCSKCSEGEGKEKCEKCGKEKCEGKCS